MPTIGNAPSGEKTTPVTTDKIPISGSQYAQLANLLKIINGLTEDTSPDNAADFILTYDNSASAPKKVKPSTFASLAQTLTNKTLIASSNVIEEITSVTSNSSITPTGGSLRNYLKVTALAEATTINAPSGTPADGNMLLMRIKDNGTSRTIAYNAIFRNVGVTAKTATTASKTIYQLARYNSADSKWDVISVTEEA